MRNLGVGHILQSIDAQINRMQEAIKDLETTKKRVASLVGGTSDDVDEMDQQDAKEIRDFVLQEFPRQAAEVTAAIKAFNRDPKMWGEVLNGRLFVPVRPAFLLKKIREVYAKEPQLVKELYDKRYKEKGR